MIIIVANKLYLNQYTSNPYSLLILLLGFFTHFNRKDPTFNVYVKDSFGKIPDHIRATSPSI